MPSVHGHSNIIMEKHKSANSGGSQGAETSTFICTVCGDGFSQYPNVLAHMAVHGPLESFSFDGSSNGFEIPREYMLQENGTLTVVNGLSQSHSSMKPLSPGILPPHLPSPIKPGSPTLRSQSTPYRDLFRQRPSDLTTDKPRQGHYRCEICSRSFNSLQSLHRHQQYRNTERGYKCTLCCKIFEGRQDLKRHLQDHATERFHCCGHCGKRFLKVDALNAHHKENHFFSKGSTLGKSDNKQEKKFEKTYSCKKCKINFFWMSDYQTHSLYHCKGKGSDATFASEIEIEVNSKNLEEAPLEHCHSNGTSMDLDEDTKIFKDSSDNIDGEYSFTPYRCGLCGDRFQKLAALKEHHLTHQTQEEIDQLNEESQKNLKRRMPPKGRRRKGSNPNGKLHPCKHCHRVFNHSSSLSRHMRYHKGTMHTCVFCGRHFPQRCDMRRHVAMYHKAELEKKPSLKLLYATPQNGSTQPTPTPKSIPTPTPAPAPSPVSVPVPVPTTNPLNGDTNPSSPDETNKDSSDNEEDPSPVSLEKRGKQSGNAGRVNYKCQDCGKKFGLLWVYQRHLRYHKKDPNQCPRCPAHFKNYSSLELHLQNHPDTGEEDDGPMSHLSGTNGDHVPVKDNPGDLEDDFMDHEQNDKGSSSEVLYECTECTETFSYLETFLQHQTSHGSENNG